MVLLYTYWSDGEKKRSGPERDKFWTYPQVHVCVPVCARVCGRGRGVPPGAAGEAVLAHLLCVAVIGSRVYPSESLLILREMDRI